MNKKRAVRAKIRRLEQIKTWQLIVLFIMSAFIAATFLRLNNIGMDSRRQAVYVADREASPTLSARLYDLQRYVSAHMNADPGRVALEHSYERDNQKRKEEYAAQAATTPNGDAYQRAEAVCGPIARAQGWRWPDMRYTNCLSEQLDKIPGGDTVKQEFQPLPPEAYYHTFVTPAWSPDFAGWSVVITGVIGLIIVGRLLLLVVLRMVLRHRRAA